MLVSRDFLEDLRVLLGTYWVSSSVRYEEANPLRHLKVNTRILNSILARTGSQCNFFSIGMMDSFELDRVTSRAAEFWIF